MHVCVLSLTLNLGSQDRHLTSHPVFCPEAVALEKPELGAQCCLLAHLSSTSTVRAEVNTKGQGHRRGWGLSKAQRCVCHELCSPVMCPYSLSLDFRVIVAGVAHLTEAGHEEVVAPMVGGGVLLDVGKLHKLPRRRERRERWPTVRLAVGLGLDLSMGKLCVLGPGSGPPPRAHPGCLSPTPCSPIRLHSKTSTWPFLALPCWGEQRTEGKGL